MFAHHLVALVYVGFVGYFNPRIGFVCLATYAAAYLSVKIALI